MNSTSLNIEQSFFRALNTVVEPAVRRGIFSSRLFPTTLIVLETTGYVSGEKRRTPLFCQQLGPYALVSTARGDRSFWVRNLQKEPEAAYFVGGRSRRANALVITGDDPAQWSHLPRFARSALGCLKPFTSRGWAFALLETR